jgi:DNA-binding response OmpR family regulator
MMKQSARILVVDDDAEVGSMLARALARHGFQIDAVRSAEEALARAAATAYDAALVDLVMPGRDGADLAAELRRRMPGIPIGILTGYTHSPLIPGVARSGVAVFTKPVIIQELLDFLRTEIT